jgi:hypothetical protein
MLLIDWLLMLSFSPYARRYIDWRIIPVLAMVYSFALIDRINLGAAYTAGMGVDLVSLVFIGQS